MRHFVESDHFRYVTFTAVRIALVYAGMLRRAPDRRASSTGSTRSSSHGAPLQTMIGTIQKSASYRSGSRPRRRYRARGVT